MIANAKCAGVPQHFERNVCGMLMNSSRNPRFMEFIQAIDTQHESFVSQIMNTIEDKSQRNYVKYCFEISLAL